MSRALAFLFFLLFLAGFALVTLKNMRSTGEPEAASSTEQASLALVSGNWRIDATSNGQTETVFVRFLADGSITGFSGCNSFFGTYVVDDKALEFGPLGATRKACPDDVMQRETSFMQALEAVSSYRINGNTLLLSNAHGPRLQLKLMQVVDDQN